MMRKRYLKEYRRGTYASLLLSGKLDRHLLLTDTLAKSFISRLVSELADKCGVDEALKARDQLAWVGAMNSILKQAEELAVIKFVYI